MGKENIAKSYYAIIPANVRYDKELTPNAKLLYGEITALCNEKGYCWASNSYFAELYGVSIVSISKWINQLVKKNYIYSEIKYKDGKKEIEERRIYIGGIHPIKEKFNTPLTKVNDPIKEKFNTPIKEKFKDNNTVFNNTFNNNSSSKTSLEDVIAYYRREIVNRHILTKLEEDFFLQVGDEISYDLAIRAMEISIESNVRELRYIKGIIKKWTDADIKTLEQLEAYKLQQEQSKQKGVKSNGSSTKRTKQFEQQIPVDDEKDEEYYRLLAECERLSRE